MKRHLGMTLVLGVLLLGSVIGQAADNLVLGVPDWDQPANYGIGGYPSWCAPTSGAMVMGYWEDKLGLAGLADQQVSPASPAYANRANDWRQGLWHDGTVEMGWYMQTDGWSTPNTQTPSTPYPYNGTLFVPDNIGPGLQTYARTAWTDPGGLTKTAFSGATATSDSTWGLTMWNRLMSEVNSGRPVVCTFDNWIGSQQGTTTIKGKTVTQYNYGVTGAHTVCGVGYIDPTPTQLNGDEWVIAQDNWPTTPQYVAVPLQSAQWRLNDYFSAVSPKAYYPLNGNANDESGNGHNGIVHGATMCQDRRGVDDSAYSFDGSDYIEVTNPPSVETYATFMAWVYVDSDGHGGYIIDKGTYNVLGSYSITIYKPGTDLQLQVRACVGGTDYWATSDQVLPKETWTHVAGVYDGTGTGLTLYVNGEFAANTPISGSLYQNASPLVFGGDVGNPASCFHGRVDDVRIYDVALSQTEIRQLVPEPATLSLLALGGLALLRRKGGYGG